MTPIRLSDLRVGAFARTMWWSCRSRAYIAPGPTTWCSPVARSSISSSPSMQMHASRWFAYPSSASMPSSSVVCVTVKPIPSARVSIRRLRHLGPVASALVPSTSDALRTITSFPLAGEPAYGPRL